MRKFLFALVLGAFSGLVFCPANAATFPNISGPGPDIPGGAISFADSVTSFFPGIVFDPDENANVPFNAFLGAQNTLGIPDVDETSGAACLQNQTQQKIQSAKCNTAKNIISKIESAKLDWKKNYQQNKNILCILF